VRCYDLAAKHQSRNRITMVPGIHYQQGAGFREDRDPLIGLYSTEIQSEEGCASLTEVVLWRGADDPAA